MIAALLTIAKFALATLALVVALPCAALFALGIAARIQHARDRASERARDRGRV